MSAHSLGEGTAGDVLAEAVAARDSGDWTRFRELVRVMTDTDLSACSGQVGLYGGMPAVAFTLRVSGRFEQSRTLAALDAKVADIVDDRLVDAERRLASGQPPRMREYDLIRGLTGLGVALLCSDTHPDLLDDVLRYTVRLLTEPLTVAGSTVPGWWTKDGPTGATQAAFQYGHANLGLAHGVAGPLAFAALAARSGHTVPGQLDAIRAAAYFLTEAARPVTGTPDGVVGWQAIGLDPACDPADSVPIERASWCYGTPGIAHAIRLAAIAIDEHPQRQWADAVLANCLTDPAHRGLFTDDTICHGWAGAYLIADQAAHDAEIHDDGLGDSLRQIARELARAVNTAATTGPSGLLTGTAGVRLAQQHRAAQHRRAVQRPTGQCDDDAKPIDWRACLLLATPRRHNTVSTPTTSTQIQETAVMDATS
jgi:hypothetical protein